MKNWKNKPKRIEAREVDDNGNFVRLVILNENQEIPENVIIKKL